MLHWKQFAQLAAVVVALSFVPAMNAGDSRDLDSKRLASLAEAAESAEDFREVSRLYELRAQMLEEKAQRHERLEERYAAAPKSLLAKRGHGWNTPDRQRDLAAKALEDAKNARVLAQRTLARADAESTDVD